MQKLIKTYVDPLLTRGFWQTIGEYIGIGRRKRFEVIDDCAKLAKFLDSRASHVAQTSLYGYLRTRAGTRFPQMFENPDLLLSINIAKWHVWLACLGDLSIFTGQCLKQSGNHDSTTIQILLTQALEQILEQTGEPDDAGPDFTAARDKVAQRVKTCDWSIERDDETVFSASPEALFYWSPIADELKQNDEAIVKNSIRYRWIEVRRLTRQLLDSKTLAENFEQS